MILWATQRRICILGLLGLLVVIGTGVSVVLFSSRAEARERQIQDLVKRAKAKAEKLKFAEAAEDMRQARELNAGRSVNWPLSVSFARKSTLMSMVGAWLQDMSKGRPTTKYWKDPEFASTLFAVRSWTVLDVVEKDIMESTVTIRINSSTKGGMPITKDWVLRARAVSVSDSEVLKPSWKITSLAAR